VARDPRWGRVEETYGEDPYLIGRIGAAYVRGLQGDDLSSGVLATAKHFLGYALSEGGMNHAPVHLGPRELREVYAEPFAAAIRDAGLASVMNAYTSIDGIPCAGSPAILDELLRDELGFDGVVVADYFAVSLLMTHHRVADSPGAAGARALSSGLDLELPGRDCYGEPLKAFIADGRLPIEVVDVAVRRVLRTKFATGLFDHPYVDEGAVAGAFDTPSDRALARRAASASIVLLTNQDGWLPLDPASLRRVAVIGPAADDARLLQGDYHYLQGDYHYPAHQEIMFGRQELPISLPIPEGEEGGGGGVSGAPADPPGEVYVLAGDGTYAPGPYYVDHLTPLAGVRAALSNTDVVHAPGCAITGDDTSGIDEAVAAADGADVALVFVGGRSGLMQDATVGEARDAMHLGLTGVQDALVRAVAGSGTPTVVVLVSGRVHAVPELASLDNVVALVQAWLPGEEGGNALADVLFGHAEPGGRLPVSMPRASGQVPVHHDPRAGGGTSAFWGDYTDGPTTPLFAFGHGMTYTTFEYGDPRVVASGTTTELVLLEVGLRNTGERPGTEVVQLYVRDEYASVARPVQQLVGFARVALDPGQGALVTFEVDPSRLAFYDDAMRFVTEPGTFRFSVGGSSDRAVHEVVADLSGAVAAFRQRDVVATKASVQRR
jgi:beta-glucosidase